MKEEKTQKKPWQKPELQILIRLKPDEAVLQGCKQIFTNGPGVNVIVCASSDTGVLPPCQFVACNVIALS